MPDTRRSSQSFVILFAFLANTFGPLPLAQAQDFRLPAPGVMVHLSPEFNPPILKGLKVHPDNPFRFDFILDKGDSNPVNPETPTRGHVQVRITKNVSPGSLPSNEALKVKAPQVNNQNDDQELRTEANKLIKYFLASLTIPEKDLWVNLSPYEKDRIIPQSFGLTEMGRDLLAEDYMLKQITASLIYPEGETGKKFWKRIYEEAAKKFGTTNIPVNTFNKVWIVPEKAVVYENAKAGTAYVVESKLKVMLEQDYLALSHTVILASPTVIPAKAGIHNKNDISALGSQIVREIIIPQLTKEVNEGKNFAQLRQVYNSLILATWYKKKIKDSILEQVYADKNKVAGVGYEKFLSSPNENNMSSPNVLIGDPEHIYQQYLKAFKKGVYNYIKEEPDPLTQATIPRKYFSGGMIFDKAHFGDLAMIIVNDKSRRWRNYLAVLLRRMVNYLEIDSQVQGAENIPSTFEETIQTLLDGARDHHQRALITYNSDGQKEEIEKILKNKKERYVEIKRENRISGPLLFPSEEGDIVFLAQAGMPLISDEVKQLLETIRLNDEGNFTNIAGIASAQRNFFAHPAMDELTHLPNKNGFNTIITRVINNQNRQGVIHFAIVVTDLDLFKEVNDFFGHQAGDELIKQYGGFLRSILPRSTDIVARWGGDEFALILPIFPASGEIGTIDQLGRNIFDKIQGNVYLDRENVLKALLENGSLKKQPAFYDKLINQLVLQNNVSPDILKAKIPTIEKFIQAIERAIQEQKEKKIITDDGTVYNFKGWIVRSSMGAFEYKGPGNLRLTTLEISDLAKEIFGHADGILRIVKDSGKNRFEFGIYESQAVKSQDKVEVSSQAMITPQNRNSTQLAQTSQAMNASPFHFKNGVLIPDPNMSEEGRIKSIKAALGDVHRNLLPGMQIINKEDLDGDPYFVIKVHGIEKERLAVDTYTNDIFWLMPSGQYVRIPIENAKKSELNSLFRFLRGDEFITEYPYLGDLPVFDKPFWSNWDEYKIQYKEKIHPAAVEAALSLIEEKFNNDPARIIRMVDIFGGNGAFLEMFDQRLREHFKGKSMPVVEYWLVDDNADSIAEASERFTAERRKFVGLPELNIHILRKDLNGGALFDEQDPDHTVPKADIITSIGGGFNAQVSKKRETLVLARRVYDALADDGRLIVTGLSAILLSADEFKTNGFIPLNFSIPTNFLVGPPKQMYVLKKDAAMISTKILSEDAISKIIQRLLQDDFQGRNFSTFLTENFGTATRKEILEQLKLYLKLEGSSQENRDFLIRFLKFYPILGAEKRAETIVEKLDIMKDSAMKSEVGHLGGIDLTPANMNLQTKMDSRFRGNDNGSGGNDNTLGNDKGIQFYLDPAMLQQLQNAPGFVPVIISVKPLEDLQGFLGIVNQTE